MSSIIMLKKKSYRADILDFKNTKILGKINYRKYLAMIGALYIENLTATIELTLFNNENGVLKDFKNRISVKP